MFFHEHLDVRTWPLFNWKPYWGAGDGALHGPISLVHFHGPKPDEYICLGGNETTGASIPDTNITDSIQDLVKQCKSHGTACWRFVELFLEYREQLATSNESYRLRLADPLPQTPKPDMQQSQPIDYRRPSARKAPQSSVHASSLRHSLRNIRKPTSQVPPKPPKSSQNRFSEEAKSDDHYSNRGALLAALSDIEAAWERIEPSQKQRNRPRSTKNSKVRPQSAPQTAPRSAKSATAVNLRQRPGKGR